MLLFLCALKEVLGRGGNTLKSPLLYSVGFTEDLRRVVAGVRASQPPSVPLLAVGFSLGSNYLAKYLGEEGDRIRIAETNLGEKRNFFLLFLSKPKTSHKNETNNNRREVFPCGGDLRGLPH